MLNKGKTRSQSNFSRNRKNEDQAQSNRDKATKAKLAHLEAVRLAQKSADKDKEPSK